MLPSIYRGVCVDNRDPKGAGRVRVSVPQLLGPFATGWAFPSWTLEDLSVWPDDRLPKPGDGIWVSFEGPDRLIWSSTFGPVEESLQKYDADPATYATTLTMKVPETTADTPVIGSLTSISGVPQPFPRIHLTDFSGSEDRFVNVYPNGTWSSYISINSEIEITADYAETLPFPAASITVPIPADPPIQTSFVMDPFTPAWQGLSTLSGTLTGGGDPVAEAEVHLLVNYHYLENDPLWGAGMVVGTYTTGKDGRFSIPWTWISDWDEMVALTLVYYGVDPLSSVAWNEVYTASATSLLAWTVPENPVYGAPTRITGTLSTDIAGIPRDALVILEKKPNGGAWTATGDQVIAHGITGEWSMKYTFTETDAEYRVRYAGSGPYTPAISSVVKVKYQLTTTVSPPNPTTTFLGDAVVVSGTVKDQYGKAVPTGSVRVSYLPADGSWTIYGSVPVSSTGAWTISGPAMTIVGATEWRTEYLGGLNGSFLPSTSSSVNLNIGLRTPVLTKVGTPTTTSATFSWASVGAGCTYTVQRQAGTGAWETLPAPTSLQYTATGLLTMTDYSFRVSASKEAPNGVMVFSAQSAIVKCNTGRSATLFSGTFVYEAWPSATGSYRSRDGWNKFGGNNLFQGAYSNSGWYRGILQYNGSTFRNWITTYHGGAATLSHLNFTRTTIWMVRNTTSYNVTSAQPVRWYVTDTTPGAGDMLLQGGYDSTALAPGWAGWCDMPAHWGAHVLLNQSIGGRTIQSFAMARDTTNSYMQCYAAGGSGNSCLLHSEGNYSYATTAAIAPRWL